MAEREGVYNLNVFEVFVITIPPTRRVVAYVGIVGVVAGATTYAAAALASRPTSPALALSVAALAFVLPTLLGGEAIYRLLPAYRRNWGLFLALVSELLAGAVLPAAFLLPFPVWDLLWLAVGVAFLNAFEVLVVSNGLDRYLESGAASAVGPLAMLAGLHAAFPGLRRPLAAHAPDAAVLLAVGAGLGIAAAFVEWLLDANVDAVDGLELTAHLAQGTDLHLGMGLPQERPVQTFAVANGGGEAVLAGPWIHPGLVGGVGGGRLTREVISALNDGGEGFFLHVPSAHFSDPADPEVHEAVLSSLSDPERSGSASRLVSRTYDGTAFHGRRYGDARLVLVESTEYGDYEIGVFGEVVDPENTLVVDRHVREEDRARELVHVESPAAEELRGHLREFLDVLDEQPLSGYAAGYAVAAGTDRVPLFALVEEVEGQRTLLLGAEQNEASEGLLAARDDLADSYDEAVVFTTDSHASVHAQRLEPDVDPDRVREVADAAAADLSTARAGLDAERAPAVDLLDKEYTNLISSLNIAARLFILSLAGLYVALAAGLLLF